MSWRNNPHNNNENAFEKFFNKKNNDRKDFKKKEEVKEPEKSLTIQIEEINKILSSGKYMSKTKKDNLLKQLEELKIKKENEFPDLVKPTVFNNTPQRSVESIWSNPSRLNKVKSNEGVDEMNKQIRIRYAEEQAEIRREKEKERQRKYYEKHKDDSDYEGEDFY